MDAFHVQLFHLFITIFKTYFFPTEGETKDKKISYPAMGAEQW